MPCVYLTLLLAVIVTFFTLVNSDASVEKTNTTLLDLVENKTNIEKYCPTCVVSQLQFNF